MIALSTRAREAIKTGVAMAIAFGLALSMDWSHASWAGITVAMISLSTAGQSLNKGAMRMVGTLIGASMGLLLIALFAQERWTFVLALSAYIGVTTYLATGRRAPYLWFVAGFVSLIVATSSVGQNSDGVFYAAMGRTVETGLGILVYTLVSVLLWPQSSKRSLEHCAKQIAASQGQLFAAYVDRLGRREATADLRPLRQQVVQLIGSLGPALEAARVDSYSVWEVRSAWHRYELLASQLTATLQRWRVTFGELESVDLGGLVPGLDAAAAEITRRFQQVERILAGGEPGEAARRVEAPVDRERIRALPVFDRSAVVVFTAEFECLEAETRALVEAARAIAREASVPEQDAAEDTEPGISLDPDRMRSTLIVVLVVWVSFITWILVNPPGHATYVQLAVILAMAIAKTPMGSPTSLVIPFGVGCLLCAPLYVFVMPALSSYVELAPMVFGYTALLYYIYARPEQGLSKMGAMIPFLVLTSITNEQSYSFASFANSSTMILLAIGTVIAVAFLVDPPRPEKIFLRLFNRFFRRADALLSRTAFDWKESANPLDRARAWLFREDLMVLAGKLAAWSDRVDPRALPGPSQERISALVSSLYVLAFRIAALRKACAQPIPDALVEALRDDVQTWRLRIQEHLEEWGDRPEYQPGTTTEDHLATRLRIVANRTRDALNEAGSAEVSEQERVSFYRLLGAYRGLSEAVVAHAGEVSGIDFARWREARF